MFKYCLLISIYIKFRFSAFINHIRQQNPEYGGLSELVCFPGNQLETNRTITVRKIHPTYFMCLFVSIESLDSMGF